MCQDDIPKIRKIYHHNSFICIGLIQSITYEEAMYERVYTRCIRRDTFWQ
jgi:hypothetical protein